MDFLARVNYIEVAGVVTGFLCVWLYIRQHVWAWPISIVSAALFIVVFVQAHLYAATGLQGIYIVLAVYGWYQWLYGGSQHSGVRVSRLTGPVAAVLAGLVVAGTGVLAFPLASYTNAALPLWDSLATVMSLAAQWMLAKKILENWLVWIVADALFVGIYLYQDLYLTAALYVAYLGLAVSGLLTWRRSMREEG